MKECKLQEIHNTFEKLFEDSLESNKFALGTDFILDVKERFNQELDTMNTINSHVYMPWVPIDKGTVVYTKKGTFAQYKGYEKGQIHNEPCQSGRYAKLWLKKNKFTMFIDFDLKPIVPLKYINIEFSITKDGAVNAIYDK
jgi:hypothetical protein